MFILFQIIFMNFSTKRIHKKEHVERQKNKLKQKKTFKKNIKSQKTQVPECPTWMQYLVCRVQYIHANITYMNGKKFASLIWQKQSCHGWASILNLDFLVIIGINIVIPYVMHFSKMIWTIISSMGLVCWMAFEGVFPFTKPSQSALSVEVFFKSKPNFGSALLFWRGISGYHAQFSSPWCGNATVWCFPRRRPVWGRKEEEEARGAKMRT